MKGGYSGSPTAPAGAFVSPEQIARDIPSDAKGDEMKHLRTIILLACLTALAVPAWSQCPDATGLWSTGDGSMLGGRASEAFCGVDGAPLQGGQPGNTQNAMSWDGATLGSQWRAWGMAIDANGASLIGSNVDEFGNGTMTYQTFYEGGQFWLAGNHTWGDGINDLTGVLTSFRVVATVNIFGGQPSGVVSNIYFSGIFVDCPEYQDCRIDFTIASAIQVWSSHSGQPMPADYPDLMCGANGGEAFDVCCIQMQIDCAVATQSETWSNIKAMYR